MDTLYEKTRKLFELHPSPGHDFKHALRVAHLAKYIAKQEGYDEREAEIAGLLHDIGRTINDAEHIGHAKIGLPVISDLLDKYSDFTPETKNTILDAIAQHSNFDS